ncbi:MAG: hypothetical protein ACKESB_01240 [Candidatus Hodgkinia cicadicola]
MFGIAASSGLSFCVRNVSEELSRSSVEVDGGLDLQMLVCRLTTVLCACLLRQPSGLGEGWFGTLKFFRTS